MPYVASGIDRRAIRRDLGERLRLFDKYDAFAASFRRRLGLASEVAQRLLHRTQAAKSLTSLDTLLRDFMLDTPATFDQANAAVEQFSELRDAHASVVTAREQEQVLGPLADHDRTITEARAEQKRTSALAAAVEHHAQRLRLERLEVERDKAAQAAAALSAEVRRAALAEDEARAAHRDLAVARQGAGGAELGEATARLESAEHDLARAQDQRRSLAAALAVLEAEVPDDDAAFDELVQALGREETRIDQDLKALSEAEAALVVELERLRSRLAELRADAEQVTATGSAMPRPLLEARRLIAEAIGQPSSVLPFAGEVLRIVEGEENWRAAIEAVASGFARHLLVPDHLYRQVAQAVDSHRLGARLSYDRMLPVTAPSGVPADAVARKIEPVPGAGGARAGIGDGLADWLNAELLRRFDHRCVEDAGALVGIERGVTRAGQVKSSRTAHVKDDRRDLADPRTWTIGVDARDRLEQIAQEVSELRARQEAAEARRDELTGRAVALRSRRDACLRARETRWQDVDVTSAAARMEALRRRCERLREDTPELAELEARLEAAAQVEDEARENHVALRSRLAESEHLRDTRAQEAEALRERLEREEGESQTAPSDTPSLTEELNARFHAHGRHLGLDELAGVASAVTRELSREREAAVRRETQAVGAVERAMTQYAERWPVARGQMLPRIDYLPDHLDRLEELRRDDLPRHERRFAELLASQTRQNVGQLANEVRRAASQVRARIGPVNDALAAAEYSPGRHLRIEVAERRLPVVTDFLADLAAISTGTLDLAEETREEAEARFDRLRRVMTRLASSDPRDATWRTQVLDTRLHVSFTAVERDETGRPVNYYEGASGLSGGQRQKLVVFCLAAALRYQLTEADAAVPGYALVVLDEAFDKTDVAFTRAGLDVFAGFGFQLLLATPMKMLQTLEEHVGGAAMVTNNEEGSDSRLSLVLFEEIDGGSVPAGASGVSGVPKAAEAAEAAEVAGAPGVDAEAGPGPAAPGDGAAETGAAEGGEHHAADNPEVPDGDPDEPDLFSAMEE
ncbi:ATP-binding protein [Actinomyces slackii]